MNNSITLTRVSSAALSVGILAGSLFTSSANAAVDEFLQVAGAPSGSTINGYKDWIDVLSFSWGVTSTANIGSGSGGAGAGKPAFQDFSWSQYIDKSTPSIFSDISTGKRIPTITFDLTKSAVGGSPKTFFEMTFTNAFITSLSYSGSSGEQPKLDGTFDYQKIKIEYWPTLPDGNLGTGVSASYDLANNKGSVAALVGLYSSGLSGGPTLPVPEPETYAMLLAGLGLIGFITYCRKNDFSDMPMAA